MPVTSTHPDYDWWSPQWELLRDAIGGEPYVKRKGVAYLPKPGGQTDDDYRIYLTGATFLGASKRTLQGLVGTMLRKPIAGLDTIPDLLKPRLLNLDRRGTGLEALIKLSVQDLIQIGRFAVQVDKSSTTLTDLPYVVPWEAEQIIDWEEREQAEQSSVLSHVRLQDTITIPDPDDRYLRQQRARIRVLELDSAGRYISAETVENDNKEIPDPTEFTMPLRRNEPLRFIPFYFFAPDGSTGAAVHAPPLLDLVNENMAHYRTSADAENVRHLTGCPTPYLADDAAQQDKGDIPLGGHNLIKLGTNGTCGFLGLTGNECAPQYDALKMRQENMAMLGSRLIEPQRVGVEASETHYLRQAGENATLVDVALSVSRGWTQILKWMAWWAGASDAQIAQIAIQLATDFIPTRIAGADALVAMQMLQAGRISFDTFIWILSTGEWLPPGRTTETEKELIEQDRASELPPVVTEENME